MYFKDVKSMSDFMNVEIELPDEIPNEMPKYTRNLFLEILSRSFETGTPPTPEDLLNVKGDNDPLAFMKEIYMKEAYNAAGMYAFVSWKWVNPFVEWIGERKVLEVMAGRGWLTHALRQKNLDVIATDNFSWADQRGWKEPLTHVEKLDAVQSIELYGKEVDIVVLGWPYMDNNAFQIIKCLYRVNPNALVVYIGEWGGCTADSEFFKHFEIMEDESFHEVAHNFQSWDSIRDSVFVGKYKE